MIKKIKQSLIVLSLMIMLIAGLLSLKQVLSDGSMISLAVMLLCFFVAIIQILLCGIEEGS